MMPSNYVFLIILLVIGVVGYILLMEIFLECFSLFCHRQLKENQVEIENLPDFYSTLEGKNLDRWVQEEQLIRTQLGYKKLFDETYTALEQEKT